MGGYLLNLGGNIKVVGERYDTEKWKAGIENPDKSSDEAYAQTLELDSNMSLVTSGSYQRFYTVNGKNYNHIIDSKTLYPAEYFASVSVLCENSALADGLSTLLFCLPFESGKKIVEETDGVYALWITNNGKKLYSDGFKDFTYE
jgi:thiamine biosynthesis lipoprotein